MQFQWQIRAKLVLKLRKLIHKHEYMIFTNSFLVKTHEFTKIRTKTSMHVEHTTLFSKTHEVSKFELINSMHVRNYFPKHETKVQNMIIQACMRQLSIIST